MRFDEKWEQSFKIQGMGPAAAEIKKVASDCALCEDDGEFYKNWTEFNIGNAISWPKDFDYGETDDLYPAEPKNQEEAVQIFFRGFWNRLDLEMKEKFGEHKMFKVRDPLHIFVDDTITKYRPNHCGFYGWVSLVVKP